MGIEATLGPLTTRYRLCSTSISPLAILVELVPPLDVLAVMVEVRGRTGVVGIFGRNDHHGDEQARPLGRWAGSWRQT